VKELARTCVAAELARPADVGGSDSRVSDIVSIEPLRPVSPVSCASRDPEMLPAIGGDEVGHDTRRAGRYWLCASEEGPAPETRGTVVAVLPAPINSAELSRPRAATRASSWAITWHPAWRQYAGGIAWSLFYCLRCSHLNMRYDHPSASLGGGVETCKTENLGSSTMPETKHSPVFRRRRPVKSRTVSDGLERPAEDFCGACHSPLLSFRRHHPWQHLVSASQHAHRRPGHTLRRV
jgi:hypothetical protein